MGKLTIKKTLAILLAVLFVASLTAAAVSAEAEAVASCSIASKTVTASGCTYSIKCSSAGSEGDEFLWSFRDGKTSTGENPSHKYALAPKCKVHSVRLTVTDSTDDTEDTTTVKV